MTISICGIHDQDATWERPKLSLAVGAGGSRCSLAAILALGMCGTATAQAALNDTGIDWWADGTLNFLTSEPAGYPGQDASHGRDRWQNDDSDGHAGFSFTKLDANGAALPANALSWSCVRDNVTGLIWEVKTNNGGLHDQHDRYFWYNTDPLTNGGHAGYAVQLAICAGYVGADPITWCNTQAYVARVNAAGLCGASDWRLPGVEELQAIADYSRSDPAIDTGYFPYTLSDWYWSSSPFTNAAGSSSALALNYGRGDVNGMFKGASWYVRLVRSEQALPPDSYSLSPKTIEAPEDVGWITFNVTRKDSAKDETLYVSTVQNLGFTNQNDYLGLLNEPLFFLETESSRPVQIQLLDDAIAESNETFGLIVQASPTDPLETFRASATFTILDNDTVAPGPLISVTPNDLDFDSVAIGQSSAIQDFTVRNTGSGILSGTCATSPPFYFAYPPCAYDLGADEFADIALHFRPESEGPSVGTVSFSSNAGNLSRTVTGTGTTPTTPQPAISVTPESLNFGSAVIGQTSPTQPVTVTNTGTANLTLGTLTVTGANPGDYQLASNTCNGKNIAPQAACAFAVAFKPAALGTRTASVSIPSNASPGPSNDVVLTGLAKEPSANRSIYGIPVEFSFSMDLSMGSNHPDVRYLQILLNSDPETRVNNNAKQLGSPGFETSLFKDATYLAVARFQDKNHNAIMPDSPLCQAVAQETWATYGCGKVGPKTRAILNNIIERFRSSEDWGLTDDGRKDSIKRVVAANRKSTVPNIEEGLILGAVIQEIGGFGFNNEWVRAVTNDTGLLNERDFGRGIMQLSSTDYVSTLNSDGEDCKNVNNGSYQCSRYYSNSDTGIYRNVTDGLDAFATKYSESNCDLVTSKCRGVADGVPFSETEGNVTLSGVCENHGAYNARVSQIATNLASGDGVTLACNPTFRAIDALWRYNGRSSAKACEGLGYVSCIARHIADGSLFRDFGYTIPDRQLWLDRLEAVTSNYAVVLKIESPANIYITDRQGRVSGMFQNTIRDEIPFSRYDEGEEYVEIPLATGDYQYVVEGFENGRYGLEILRARNDERNLVRFSGVPISKQELHRIVVDWEELAAGGRGVTMERDRFGDGTVVDSFTIGATLEDSTPPTTTPQVVGNMGALGRYNGAVTVTVAANDGDGVGVQATHYALDDGPWVQYRSGVPLVISTGGTHRIEYYSVDFFGNTEATQEVVLRINYPPSADAGAEQTKQCRKTSGAVVTLDGRSSQDPDGDLLTFTWTGPFGNMAGETATVEVPLGTHTIALEVVDANGAVDTDTVRVSVEDAVAPTLQVSVAPKVVWPPNNKMVPIAVTVTSTDACDTAPRVTFQGITANEPTKARDIVVDAEGSISLRATRLGRGSGRVYTIRYTAEDASGNSATGSASVTVPHNR